MQKREIKDKLKKTAIDDVTKMLVRNDAPAVVVDVVVLIPDIAFFFAFLLFSIAEISSS